jgi:hypothetical protein
MGLLWDAGRRAAGRQFTVEYNRQHAAKSSRMNFLEEPMTFNALPLHDAGADLRLPIDTYRKEKYG